MRTSGLFNKIRFFFLLRPVKYRQEAVPELGDSNLSWKLQMLRITNVAIDHGEISVEVYLFLSLRYMKQRLSQALSIINRDGR